ncbi:hypothetical protein [Haloplanus salinus]|uniref:hypothetical protein n=1 Tax=Haloplanus salinus TaxID=1126245 RepID=UPI001C69F008|nr:hypothetical protein [Haloplanus salinus]
MTDDDLAPDEVYCTSCGEPIKKEAEICPECGVKNKAGTSSSSTNFESSGIVGSDGGRIISWVAGVFFLIGGLGMLVNNLIPGFLSMLMGAFLVPPIRSRFEEEIDYTFPRWAVVGIVFFGMFVAGSVMPQGAGNANFSLSGGDGQNANSPFNQQSDGTMPSGDPTEPVNKYYTSILGTLPNYERAARQAQQDVDTNSAEFNEFKTYWENQRSMNRRSGITAELGYTELVNKNETRANVTAAINLYSDGYNYETKELSIILEASNGEWLVKKAPNPYPTEGS